MNKRIVNADQHGTLLLGRQGENEVSEIVFPIPSDLTTCDWLLNHRRATDKEPYPIPLASRDNTLVWTVTAGDTDIPGRGYAELTCYGSGGEVLKSQLYATTVIKALTNGLEVPDPVQPWYESLLKRIDSVSGVTTEDISAAVESYLEENPIEVPEVDLSGVVKSVNGVEPDESGNVEIEIPEGSQNAYKLPIAGDELGGVKNGGNVVINADGTMTAPETGGTDDYTALSNKPKINGVELSGDKPLENFGIGSPTDEQVAQAVGEYLDEHPTTEYYSLEDKKKFPEYYGIDIDNGVRSDVTVPDGTNRMPKENLSIIIPNTTFYVSTIKVIGDTTVSYNSTHSTILVDGVVYGIHRWELADLPANPSKWKLTVAINSAQATNSTTWFVADMPLEEITAKFIKSECTESVSITFLKAVSVAKHGDAPVSEIYSLKGKVWLALGDSYTQYLAGRYSDGVTPSTAGKWSALANQLGMSLYSYGLASSTIRYSTNNGSDGYSYQPMVTRVDTLIADHEGEADNVGLITFMGGLNDSEFFLGDLKSVENTTIYGACHQIFNKLLNAFPKAKIVVVLQPVTGNSAPPADSEFSGMSNAQYSIYKAQLKQRAVKEVAEFYGLTICDCCFDWYTTANPNHLSIIWNSDLIHLTDLGNRDLTVKLAKILEGTLV